MSDLRDLYSQLRYQLAPVGVTTMGTCPECFGGSRGGQTCAHCLARQMKLIAPAYSWANLVECLKESRRAIVQAEGYIEQIEMTEAGRA